jgi:hypothetical protein
MFAGAWGAGTFLSAEKGGEMYIGIGALILIILLVVFVF